MDNLKEIENSELEYLDGGNFKNKKYLKLQGGNKTQSACHQ